MTRIRTARASLLAALLLPGLATAAGLNDTGITKCANNSSNDVPCNNPNFPRQDAETGRDAQTGLSKADEDSLASAGFDFTKLDASGNPLPADATNWNCVRDNVTGLIWEVKTDDDGLRDKDWTYTWYNTDTSTNGSFEGYQDVDGVCGSGSVGFPEHCNTQAYVAAVNAAGLCGYNTDWRMPTVEELRGIVDYSGINPTIDAAYFPNTRNYYWSASPSAPDAYGAWVVLFGNGNVGTLNKDSLFAVRLVRGGE